MAELDPNRFCEHADALREFSQRLSARGFTVYEHFYADSMWGLCRIIAGRGGRRFRFAWDWRDSELIVEAEVPIRPGVLPDWRHLQTEPTPYDVRGTFQQIEEYLTRNAA